jgi:diguanylate cyclase (GGDEF)-like protein
LIFAAIVLFPGPVEELLATAPYTPSALLALGALLAWRFRRSRILFALVILALTAVALPHLASGGGADVIDSPEALAVAQPPPGLDSQTGTTPALGEQGPTSRVALLALAFLLPLNLSGIALLSERGVLTRLGIVRLGLILAQAAAVSILVHIDPAKIGRSLEESLLPAELTTWTSLPDLVLLAFSIAVFVILARLLLRPDPVTRGLLWTLPASFLLVDAALRGEPTNLYLAAGPLIMIVSIVESSFAMAYRDGLTGLPGRRAFNEEVMKLGGRYTIAMVDIDHFKRCNDRHGHDVGDQVLRMVATRLDTVSGGGKAFRYGGEEFAIIFHGKNSVHALPHLESLREAIKETSFTIRAADRPRRKPKKAGSARSIRAPARTITVTVSIGVAERSPRFPEPDAVIKAADKALYRAKKAGRNRVVA